MSCRCNTDSADRVAMVMFPSGAFPSEVATV
jgi:hypothetical protein